MKIEAIVSKEPWRFLNGDVRQPAYIATFVVPVEELRQTIETEGADKVAVELFNVLIAEIQALEGKEVGRI